jgi:hypothetical protein
VICFDDIDDDLDGTLEYLVKECFVVAQMGEKLQRQC